MTSLAVARNVLRRILRDGRTLALIIILPLFFVLIYGNSFSGLYSNLAIAIVNEDNGLASVRTQEVGRVTLTVDLATAFINALDADVFDIVLFDDAEQAIERVGDGFWAALVFPKSFSNAVVSEAVRSSGQRTVDYEGSRVTILPSDLIAGPLTQLVIDDSNPLVAGAVLAAFDAAFAAVLETQQSSVTVESLLDVRQLYEGQIRMLDFTAPGIIGFAMTLITVMLTAMAVVRERTGGTLTRILIAPVSAGQVTLGYTLAFTLIALFQAAELFLVSLWLFDIRFIGDPGAVILVIVLFAIGLQGIATLISTIAKNEAQAMQFVSVPAHSFHHAQWRLLAARNHVRNHARPLLRNPPNLRQCRAVQDHAHRSRPRSPDLRAVRPRSHRVRHASLEHPQHAPTGIYGVGQRCNHGNREGNG